MERFSLVFFFHFHFLILIASLFGFFLHFDFNFNFMKLIIIFLFLLSNSTAIKTKINKNCIEKLNFFFYCLQQEANGRRFAEELNERVLWWSLIQTLVIFAISVSQVLVLRNFFSETKPKHPTIPPRQPRYGGYARM